MDLILNDGIAFYEFHKTLVLDVKQVLDWLSGQFICPSHVVNICLHYWLTAQTFVHVHSIICGRNKH